MLFDETMKSELEDILALMGTDAFDSDAKLRLAALVSESDEARRIYLQHCQMHAMLHQSSLLAAFNVEKLPDDARTHSIPSRLSLGRRAGLIVAACAMLVIGAISALYFRHEPATDLTALKVASVQRLNGRAWFKESELTEGADVSRGVVRVESGSMDLRFENGTTLRIRGPAELSIDSDMQVSLKRGQLAARVPEAAHGFTVLGPDSAVVDLGTEFGMVVQDGKSWVEVYDGEVDVALLNEDGHAWKNQQLTPTGPVRIDGSTGRIVDDAPPVALPRFSGLSLDGLEVPAAYVDAVLKSGAAHYWRFEKAAEGRVADTAGDAAAVLNGGARLHDHCLHLPPGERNQGFVFIAKPSQSLLNGEFTLEAWVKPSIEQRSTLIEVNHREPASKSQQQLYRLALLSSHEQTIYPNQKFRFLCRLWPHGERGAVSTFSAGQYLPGSWHHVVAVRRKNRLEVYLDGKPSQTVPALPPVAGPLPSTISIGKFSGLQGRKARPDRLFFKGMVDEVAVYPSAMSAEEVAKHYRLMQAR
jgi:ferric-dicitrate binding protein FerR (iron transport regulator)